ncbi:MAG TPA: alpha/beta fold hydrolase, partial [Acidimicrobiia bacterium]|nr:alpha/beta fold hydrolase [Acidimicrobiia bacterium]
MSLAATAVGDQGPPVVLLHGGGQTRHAWAATAGRLAVAGFSVLTFDLRGHGESSWAPDGDYSDEVMLADLEAVLSTVRDVPALVGASTGGALSLRYAGGRGRVSAIVLVDFVPRLEVSGVERVRSFMLAHADGFESLEQAQAAVAAYAPRPTSGRGSAGLRKNLRQGRDGRWRWHWDPAFMRPAVDPAREATLVAAARALTAPTLLVRGARSDVVTPAGVRDFLSLAPHARHVEVPDRTHMI